MKHIIFFTYVAAIPIIIVAMLLLIFLRKNKGDSIKPLKNLEFFIGSLFLSLVIDMLLYYNNIIFDFQSKDIFYEICDLVCNLGILCWLNAVSNIYKNKLSEYISSISKYYFVAYFTAWIITITGTGDIYDSVVMRILNLMLVILMGTVLGAGVYSAIKKQCSRVRMVLYCELVTILLLAVSFIYTVGIYDWYYSDYTVVFWLVIAAMVCMIEIDTYKNNISVVVQAVQPKSSEEAINELGLKHGLTTREIEILEEIFNGKNNQEISEKFVISESTVKAHIHNMLKKLEARNRVEVICKIQDTMKKTSRS